MKKNTKKSRPTQDVLDTFKEINNFSIILCNGI